MLFVRRVLSRRWLLAFLGVAAALFGLAMLHPYPRQSLFGPTIRGKPWCVWEAEVRRFAHQGETERTWSVRIMRWLGVKEVEMEYDELFNHAEMLPLLVALAEDSDEKVRSRVVGAFASCDRLRDPLALPMLRRRLDDADTSCRLNAASAIWQIDPQERVYPVLLRILDDRHDDSRAHAIGPLAFMCKKDPELLPHFARYATDEEEGVREDVMLYAQLFGAKALPILRQGLEDRVASVRGKAINSLKELGPDAKDAVPALMRRLKDDDAKVRAAAVEALLVIEPERFEHLKLKSK